MKKNLRILVVDDDTYIRTGLSDLLTMNGYYVDTAPSGEEAFYLVENNTYHLVLSDIKMPGMDGLELLRKIKKIKPDLGVVLLTAFATVTTALDAMKDGASDFITKPFDVGNLLRVVKINTRRFMDYVEDKELVDNQTRDRIFDLISMNPGVNFRSIGKTLQLGNGVLDYHLHLLEKKELIRADRDGIYKRYYPHTVKVAEKKRRRLSSIQASIIELVRGNEGINQLEISKKLEMSKQLVNYHVKQLASKGILIIKKDGNVTRIMIGKEG